MVKVSVVVPVYNVKMYLAECVNSLLCQTLNDIDIILVDDGSTDGSESMCDSYAKENKSVRVIHKENGGLGSARNVGLDAATGEYVYFIDGDDSIKKDALEKLYDYAEKDSLDVILFSAECFSDDLSLSFNPEEYKKSQALYEVLSGKEMFIKLVDSGEYYASIPLKFYRTEYLQKKDYRFPEHIIHEDEIISYWSLIQAKASMSIPDRLYNRRYRAGSIMTSKKAYDSSEGCIYTWRQIMLSLGELSDWSEPEKERAIRYANSILRIAADLYAKAFENMERRRMNGQINDLCKIAESVGLDLRKDKYICLFLTNPRKYRKMVNIYDLKCKIKSWVHKLLGV